MLKGYRTILANLALSAPLLAPIVLQLVMSEEFKALIPAAYMPAYAMSIVIINLVLRALTTTAIGHAK